MKKSFPRTTIYHAIAATLSSMPLAPLFIPSVVSADVTVNGGASPGATYTNAAIVEDVATTNAMTSINNTGNIESDTDNANQVKAQGQEVALKISHNLSTLDNSGNILLDTSSAEVDRDIGVLQITDGAVVGTITNSGTIDSDFMPGANDGIQGMGIDGGANVGSLTNTATGLIRGYEVALRIAGDFAAGTTVGSIVNAGTIESIDNTGVRLSHEAAVGSITNSGTIVGNDGTGLSIGWSSIISGAITNTGTISGDDGSGLVLATESRVDGGITNQAGGTISGANGYYGINLRTRSVIANITNSGDISGQNGIYLQTGSSISGGITNSSSGTITAQINAIYVWDGGTNIAGGITNDGSIIGGEGGIVLQPFMGGSNVTISGDIINTNVITGGNFGIILSGADADISGTIVNSGTITGTNQFGIGVAQGDISGGIDNSGVITSTNSFGIGVFGQGDISGGINNSGAISGASKGITVVSSDISGSIANQVGGTITGTTGFGIAIDSSSDVTAGITNYGTISGAVAGIEIGSTSDISGGITNHAGGLISYTPGGNYRAGIYLNSSNDISGGINNMGTIQGILLEDSSNISGGITNSGTITGCGFGIGIYALSGNNISGGITNLAGGTISGATAAIKFEDDYNAVINNSGLIDGNIILDGNILNLNGTTGRVTGTVSDTTGVVNVNGTFTTENIFNVNDFSIVNGGVFNMAHAVTSATALSNDGTLGVAAGNVVTITGDYTQTANGIFQTGATNDSTYGRLTVSGTADLSASNKVNVVVTAGNTLTEGNVLTDVITAGTLTAGALTVTDNSAIWSFTGIVDSNTIDLSTERSLAFVDAVGGSSSVAHGAATVMDALITRTATPNADMQTVLDEISALATAEEVAQAVQQTLPTLTGHVAISGMNMANSGAANVVHNRLSGFSGFSAGDMVFDDRAFWVKPFGSWTKQSERDGVDGFDADTYGLAIGAEARINSKYRLGAALSYASTDVDSDSSVTASSVDIDSYQLTLYGEKIFGDAISLNVIAAYGLNKNDSTRRIAIGGLNRTATGDFDSWHTLLDAELEHVWKINDKVELAAAFRGQYSYISVESHTEKGAGALNLQNDKTTEDSLVASLGGKANYAIRENHKLFASVDFGYDFMTDQSVATSTYTGGGASFVTEGMEPDKLVYHGGLGYEMLLTNGMELTARYDVEARDDYINQAVSVNFRLPF